MQLEAHSKRGIGEGSIDSDTAATRYTASGGASEITFSGTVDGLTDPFTLDATFIGGAGTFAFDPGSGGGLAGTVSISGGGGGATLSGGGTYTITENDDGTATLTSTTEACVDVSGICREAEHTITLTPVD